ncbi:phage terminase large subunit family protein [Microvirga sp. P5_D2]
MLSQARWSEPDAAYQGAEAIEDAIRKSLQPDPVLTVSEWADRYRILSTKLAAEAGPYRTDRTPFLREVMDALSPTHPARRIVFMKGAQVGATEAGNNWLGYIVHWSPAPVMGVWPTVDTAKKVSQQRIGPLIEDSPELAKLIAPAKQKDSGNTVLAKSFPGGILVMTGANSAVGLRSMPARYAFCDEIDAYPGDVDGEGDPIALVANRTTTFGRTAKMFLVSTPTVHGESRIEREFEMSDQRRYFVPCPHCKERQWLQFERLRWERGQPETVHYVCEHCGALIEERHKATMLPEGIWQPTAEPKDPGTVGFHISALYSPLGWMSWEDIAREWEAAQGDVSRLKTFKNTRLGETWFEQGEQVDWERIYERRESWKPGTLPSGVTLLLGAVDVQASPARVELHVWGFGEDLESWAIDRRVSYGTADDPKTWEMIEEALEDTWIHASGAELKLDLLAVDTGDQTTAVYSWISKQDQSRVYAVKGKRGYEINAPVGAPTNIPFGTRKRAIRLRSVTGDVFKAELYRFLALSRPTDEEIAENGFPPGYVHVPDFMDADWCKQLTAEKRIRRSTGRYEWKKEHDRNEALDCRVYARAALWTMGVAAWKASRWASLRSIRGLDHEAKENDAPRAQQIPAGVMRPARRVVRSGYMGR